ncbi:MAG: phasin family protein [Alphaproteobacteria bacterium]|nr:phasin family protein [Alphaproteobacteria bacterium]
MPAAKKDAAREAFDTVTTASNDAIKEGFDKSVNALNDFTAFQKDTVDAMIASATTAAKSLEDINTSALAYAKKSMEDTVSVARTMAGAKSVQELIEVQADYAKTAMDAYLAEINRQSELMSGLVKHTFKPLNDRAAAAVELMQSQR